MCPQQRAIPGLKVRSNGWDRAFGPSETHSILLLVFLSLTFWEGLASLPSAGHCWTMSFFHPCDQHDLHIPWRKEAPNAVL